MQALRLHLSHHRLFFGLQLCADDLGKPLANRLLSRRGESASARRARDGRQRRPGRRDQKHGEQAPRTPKPNAAFSWLRLGRAAPLL